MSAAVGFIGSSCEVLETGAGHYRLRGVMTSGESRCRLNHRPRPPSDCPAGTAGWPGRRLPRVEQAAQSTITMPIFFHRAVTGSRGVEAMDGATVSVAVVASRTEAELIVGMLRSYGLRAAAAADGARRTGATAALGAFAG